LKKIKILTASVLSAVLASSVISLTAPVMAAEKVLLSGAWYETMYAEFTGSATAYNAYYKKTSETEYTKVDDELVRKVDGDKYRVDVPGLAGNESYDLCIYAVNGTQQAESPFFEYTATPEKYDRSGFAFDGSSNAPGAYNADGTVADGALILYVTNENSTNVYKNKDLTSLLSGLNSLNSGKPVIIRIIGRIDPIKNKTNVGMWKNTCGVTVEGIGPNAGFIGWGISGGDSSDTEFRNLSFIDYQEDALGFEGAKKLWVHNNTFYSGYYPKDSTAERDKLHGDGSCDLRECNTTVVSYNEFSGTDKTSLIGSSSSSRESTGNLTFHHNFFDHTNQRTPRMRWHNMHAYNNYYLYTGAYGIGATCNSNIFAENNYFEKASSPFLTSSQGGYASKFSDNDGGVIKAFGNITEDCYEFVEGVDYFNAPSREYRMTAADFTTVKGGYTYNNFDANGYIASNDYILHSAQQAKTEVLAHAGRLTDTKIDALEPISPPVLAGHPASVYYYDAPESGSTGEAFGGLNGEGTYFKASGTSCKAATASGYREAVKYNYSGSFSTGSNVSFTTNGPAKFTIIASTTGKTPVRTELVNAANPSAVYHGYFQTGNSGNDVLSTVTLTEAGDYYFKSTSAIDIYYMEVVEYAEGDYEETSQSTTENTTQSTTEITTETTTEITTEITTEQTTEETSQETTEGSSEATTENVAAVKGDSNSDSVVNRADYILISKFFAGYPVQVNVPNSDINEDNIVNRADYMLFAKYFAGDPSAFEVKK